MKQEVGTIVGSSVHLTGAIKDSSDITIFGVVEGEVASDQKVIVEESAHVKGPIKAAEVVVSGMVVGTITATQRIELNQAGTIKGNIDAGELLIHAGATFIGKCNMPDKKDKGDIAIGEDFKAEVEDEDEDDDTEEKEK